MKKFLCLQRNLPGATAPQGKPSPTEMQAMYEAFNTWRERHQSQLVDLGGRLGKGRLVSAESAQDGPLVEVKELVGGYMIVAAADLDEAARIASACPGLVRPGSGVEVIEIHTPPG
jgi:hypothetical protein